MDFCKFYTKILQFGNGAELSSEVTSDHGEIILKTNYVTISSWNISNPIHHHYFGLSQTSTFSRSHMAKDVRVPEEAAWLEHKIQLQVSEIIQRMVSGQIDIQIIVEGYVELYQSIIPILSENGLELFYDESPVNTSENPTDKINVTGIIIRKESSDFRTFQILSKIIYTEVYTEENDVIKPGEVRKLRTYGIPVLHLLTGDSFTDPAVLIVGGVHIHGSNSRFPKSGLNLFKDTLLRAVESRPDAVGIIFMGDFNTVPKNVGDVIKGSKYKIMLTEYPTMVNPGNEVSYYDMAVIYGSLSAKILGLEFTGTSTQALVESICRSRRGYLATSS